VAVTGPQWIKRIRNYHEACIEAALADQQIDRARRELKPISPSFPGSQLSRIAVEAAVVLSDCRMVIFPKATLKMNT
jgi:hypothetical protein